MKVKASDMALKHLNDVQSIISMDVVSKKIMNRDIDFVKWLISEYKGDLNKEVDIDETWKRFIDGYPETAGM